MNYAIVDIETTGGSPKNSKITEIAIYIYDGKEIIDEFVSLVNPEAEITQFVVKLTGITNAMVKNAPKFHEVAKKIVEITENCIFVAHNVSFDYHTLRHEFKQLGYDYRKPHLCTVRASKYVLPGHDSYSLGKITKDLGIEINGRHRAGGDALATAKLFDIIFHRDKTNLASFVQNEIDPSVLHPKLDMEFIDNLPSKNGIYKLIDEMNEILYIGKGDIKKKVETHFKNDKTNNAKTLRSSIASVEFQITGSELISVIEEYHSINNFPTKYNKQSKNKVDDYQPHLACETFFILDKGRHKGERSLIYFEDGLYQGYGYAPFHYNNLPQHLWHRFITEKSKCNKTQEIIEKFLQKNTQFNIVSF